MNTSPNNTMDLLPELVSLIAFQSHGTWYAMASIDRVFHEYSCSQAGKDKFRELFMVRIPLTNLGEYAWTLDSKVHNYGGDSAITRNDGSREWYQHGRWHRDDGPAIIHGHGSQRWYQHDKLHRDDGPAILRADGSREWWLNDAPHRDDGPAIIHGNGDLEWYQYGKFVRLTLSPK